ncbi:MAG: CoA-binding protein [Syntrophus sp. (in: bacteria)]|nr:CoA-binding protein [Syntrophus sp. (in: bacteria)]
MEFFFNPQGIAVVGATPNPLKGGNAILKNVLFGYRGQIFPVNPKYTKIEGLTCYPSVSAIPGPVDLAIVFVPAPLVPAAVEDCVGKGVRGVIIESGGFAEAGPEGERLQKTLTDIAARTGIRLWGPNCMGLVDCVHRHIFSFMDPRAQEREEFIPGTVSLVVQSGMLSAIFLIDIMSNATMGVSKVCSVGNKVDINECDILEYFLYDPDTEVIGLYLESFSDGRRFLDLCRRSGKPIVVLKGGRSRAGAEAALSHTASLAGNQRIIAGALAQAGVSEARDFKQMMDLCRSFAVIKPAPGGQSRVAVLTLSGGAGIVATDFMAEHGLTMANLSASTRNTLEKLFPKWMPVTNPVDLWPAMERQIAADVDVYSLSLEALLSDPEVDAVFLHVFISNPRSRLNMSELAARIHAAGKPIIIWIIGRRDDAYAFQKEALAHGIPVFTDISRAAECLAAVLGERYRPAPMIADKKDHRTMPNPLQELLNSASGPLDEHLSKEVLRAGGIPTVQEEIAVDAAHAEAVAAALGYPVVMKGLLPGGIHKTELGLVCMGIHDDWAARVTFASLMGKMEGRGRVLIQKQHPGRVELILGLLRDPQFGPCVMFGLGGVMAELIEDSVFAVAPLTHEEALKLIGRVRSSKVLDGFRGAPPVNREEIVRILIALGEIGLCQPRIREIDINPLIIGEEGAAAVDATIVLG